MPDKPTAEPTPADDRPVRSRRGVRVVVVSGDEVLLQGDTDLGLPGARFWQTPGGGIDDGESSREAAVRELAEEAGLIIDGDALVGPIARRRVRHGYSDRILIQDEEFFLLRSARFEPVAAGLTEAESRRHVEIGWYPLSDLPRPTWPEQLADLVVRGDDDPLDLGDMDESTVPID